MWPFKKKVIPVEKKEEVIKPKEPIFILKSEKKSFNIQRTKIKVRFTDGKYFSYWVYGGVHQSYSDSNNAYDKVRDKPYAKEVVVYLSLPQAEYEIKNLEPNRYYTLVDDSLNPRKSVIGMVKKAFIKETEDYSIFHEVRYLEEVKK